MQMHMQMHMQKHLFCMTLCVLLLLLQVPPLPPQRTSMVAPYVVGDLVVEGGVRLHPGEHRNMPGSGATPKFSTTTATGLEWSGPLTGRNCPVQRAADTPLESMPPGE